jgi:disulfide bond formation protein DsbB
VSIAIIKAQAPALADLDSLCVPDKQIPAGLKLLAALTGAILSLVLLGAASGLVHAGHEWVMRFVGR